MMATAPVTCRKCSQNIPPEDVNVSEGVAFCRACSVLSRLGDMLDEGLPDIDLSQLPHGCELIDDGREILVRASLRSLKSALTALPIALFWNGCLTVFVVQAIAVSYRHIYGQNASWLPAPNWPQFPNALPPVWFSVFFWLFLCPFMAIGIWLICAFVLSAVGRVEVRIKDSIGLACVLCGPVGWKRKFDANAVNSITIELSRWWHHNNQPSCAIVINADRTLRIGAMLADERRDWMTAALRKLLVH